MACVQREEDTLSSSTFSCRGWLVADLLPASRRGASACPRASALVPSRRLTLSSAPRARHGCCAVPADGATTRASHPQRAAYLIAGRPSRPPPRPEGGQPTYPSLPARRCRASGPPVIDLYPSTVTFAYAGSSAAGSAARRVRGWDPFVACRHQPATRHATRLEGEGGDGWASRLALLGLEVRRSVRLAEVRRVLAVDVVPRDHL